MDMIIDYFGFLDKKESFSFEGGRIKVLDSFQESKEWVESFLNKDGFVYPPLATSYSINPLTMERGERIPNSERPALFHTLPASHSIELDIKTSIEEQRRGPLVFLINLLSVFFGTRLQFHELAMDGRIPIKENTGFSIRKEVVEDFLSHSFKIWKTWKEPNQNLIINLLFMFSRTPHYEWDWERFMMNYLVFDGLWKLYKNLNSNTENSYHSERIIKICNFYKIPVNPELIKEIVGLRNNLFHETVWDNGKPTSSGSQETTLKILFLKNLNTRLIPAIFEYHTPFIKTEWWHMGRFTFDKA
jgi:hypothetical protein